MNTKMETLTPQTKAWVFEKIQELEIEKQKNEDCLKHTSFLTFEQCTKIQIELLDSQIKLLKSKLFS